MAEGTENPVEAGQFLGDDGAFQEGWQGLAFPDDNDPHKTDPTLANIKDFRSMAKMVVSSQKQIGQLSGGREFAILPNEQSSDDERNAYHTKVGRPDAPEGYKLSGLALPEGIQKDEKFAAHMSKVLFDAGTPLTAGIKITNGYLEHIKASMDAVATQDKIDAQEANKQLRGVWGAAYDKNMALAISAANAFGGVIDAAETAALIKELPYDSFASQMLAKAGEVIAEKGLGEPTIPASGELTPADAMTKINELIKDPYYVTDRPPDKPANKAYHDELVEKVKKLFEIRAAKA